MDKHYESIYHSAEDTNWWFRTRQDFVYRYLIRSNTPTNARILDIGCGGGGLLSYLQERGYTNTAGIDLSPEAIAFCRSRGLTQVHLDDAQHLNTQHANSFDIIIASDVLEHMHNPREALARWKDLLSPNGELIIFVPAFQALWSERDVLNHHTTRYTKKTVLALTTAVGLHTHLWSHWNFFMLVPYALILKLKRYSKNKIIAIHSGETLINRILTLLLRFENTLILSGVRLPFGVSFLAIFKK